MIAGGSDESRDGDPDGYREYSEKLAVEVSMLQVSGDPSLTLATAPSPFPMNYLRFRCSDERSPVRDDILVAENRRHKVKSRQG